MKRKQLLALGVAGILSVGSVSSSVLAVDNTETIDVNETTDQAETDGQSETEENAETADLVDTTENAETITPKDNETENTEEGNTSEESASEENTPEGNKSEEKASDVYTGSSKDETEDLKSEEESSDKQSDVESESEKLLGEEDAVVTSFEDLKAKISEITDTGSLTLAGEFVFDSTIEIPENVVVSLIPQEEEESVSFKRADGFGGSFFNVNGTLMVVGSANTPFILDGTSTSDTVYSMMKVNSTGMLNFTNAELRGNASKNVEEPNGGAITNLGGTVLLADTLIQGNTTNQKGNGVYSTSVIALQNKVVLDDVFLGTNDVTGNGTLYYYDTLTGDSSVSVGCDSSAEYYGTLIANGEPGVNLNDVLAKTTYTNSFYKLVSNETNDILTLADSGSVTYTLSNDKFSRYSFTRAVNSVSVKADKSVTTQTRMYYIVDPTGAQKQPDYSEFSDYLELKKKEDGVPAEIADLASNNSKQKVWYYFAEVDGDGNIVYKDKIASKNIPAYKINLAVSAIEQISPNGFKTELTVDADAIGGNLYYLWIDPLEIADKSAQEVVDDYLKAKGTKMAVKSTTIKLNPKSDDIKNLTGAMRLYCYVENKVNSSTVLKSNVKTSKLTVWTPAITKYAIPYYEKDGKTYYDYVNLHLDLAHCSGGEVLISYVDMAGKSHVINLGHIKSDTFDKTIPIRTVKLKNGSSFEVKSYSIYTQIKYENNGKTYTKQSNVITPAIDPTPTPAASPTVTPTETPSPVDPGADKSVFVGLSSPYLSGAKVVFGVMGAGMNNNKPNKGDIRYYPYRWKAAKTPQSIEQVLAWVTSSGTPQGSFTPSSNGYFYASTSKTTGVPEGSYPVTVVFKKQIFDGNQWVDTGSYAKLDKYFEITKDPNRGVHTDPGSDDDNVYEDHGTYYQVLSNGSVVVVTPAIQANSVSDNIIYKVLPDGTRLIRKLKLTKAPADGSKVPDIIYIGDDGKPYELKQDGTASKLTLSAGAEFEAIDGMIYKVLDDGTIISTGKTTNGDILTDNIVYKVLKDGTKLIRKLKLFEAPENVTVPEVIYLGDDGKAYQLQANGEATAITLPVGTKFEAIDGIIYEVVEGGKIVSTGKTASGETVAQNDHIKAGEAAPTGDDTPIVYMISMLALSMLAGGYVLVRRRKKTS